MQLKFSVIMFECNNIYFRAWMDGHLWMQWKWMIK